MPHSTTVRPSPAGSGPSQPVTVHAATLRAAFRRAPAGLAIVTTSHDGHPLGLTVTSLRSLSTEPALIAFSITRTASTWPAFAHSDEVLVHLLDERHQDLAERFAASGVDRFAPPVRHHRHPAGPPRLVGPAHVLHATVTDRLNFGDAALLVAAVRSVDIQSDEAQAAGPLIYHDGGFHLLHPAPPRPADGHPGALHRNPT